MNSIKLFSEISKGDIKLVGGKGLSLALLTQAGFPVPPGLVITTIAYKSAQNNQIGPDVEKEILAAFDALGADRVAVRSSAIAEDSPDASWAGQFESFLNVQREQLIESVKKCWQSASSEIVKNYAESNSTSDEQLAIAVAVQKMVESEVSGVAFSVNPITKDNGEMMIEAIYGLGELLVQGMITPDNYIVNRQTHEVTEKNIKTKTNMLVYRNGQNIEEAVPENKRDESCLNDEEISELARLVDKIEKFYGKPQDIEWALEDNEFYIVQSRPITTI